MSAPILVLGRGGGNHLYEAHAGFTDDGVAYQLRGRSNRVAPAGVGGEAIFTTLFLAILHTMAADLIVVPIIDEVALTAQTVSLEARTTRTLDLVEIPLTVPLIDGVGIERGRFAARGTWFQLEAYDDGLAAGDLILEVSELEYEIVRQVADVA